MKKRFWIKLSLDMLDDIKLGPLPDFMKWRAIELYLVAGENGNDGLLPPVERLAWRLRLPHEKLEETLSALSQAGVVHETPQGWVVTDFVKSQAALTSKERMQNMRRRKEDVTIRNKNGYENVTVVVDDSTSTSSSSSDSFSFSEIFGRREVQGEEKPRLETRLSPILLPANVPTGPYPPVDIFRVYHENIGPLTPMIAEALQDAEKSDGPEWICAAIDEAVKNNARSWKYVQAILERWRRDGFQVDTRLQKTSSRSRRGGGISEDQIQKWMVSGPEEHTK